MTYLTVECKGLMNPENKPMSQKPYVTDICKGLMNPYDSSTYDPSIGPSDKDTGSHFSNLVSYLHSTNISSS